MDPAGFDIHIEADNYDALLAFVMAQRKLFGIYGYRTPKIMEGLYQPGNIKEMRATVPRCEESGIGRLARAGML